MSSEERIHVLDKELISLKISHEKDMNALREATKLQALEYERRLNILNGEAGRLREIQATYLPREVWDNAKNELVKEINDLKTYKDNALGRQAVFAIIIPALISLLVGFILRGIKG